ncbi:MAG TPA: ethanolamine ammonia-lyase reactivating factor EutA [Candidatus Binatia bacterium]
MQLELPEINSTLIPIPFKFHEGHDDDQEHDEGMLDEDHPMWRSERISLTSVGIDIGSSTSHLIFSRLTLRRQGVVLSSRFVVVKREILSESPILLTPYVDKTTIDTQKLDGFIQDAYRRARLTPADIDTGALILTGEAAKKKNAEAVAALFAAQAGKFVCATAGHNLEAVLAAYGSGAIKQTINEGGDFTVMNVDVGGGTCKISISRHGAVVDTACLEVGARLVALGPDGKINRLEDAGLKIGQASGVQLRLGGPFEEQGKQAMTETLCNALFEVLERGKLSALTQDLMLTPELEFRDRIDVMTFSGGVSEYVYGNETTDYGDLGNHMGRAVRTRAENFAKQQSIRLQAPEVRIRATVIGASQYTVQVSGNTIYLSDGGLLPLRNVQVVIPQIRQEEPLDTAHVREMVDGALRRFDIQDGERPAALAIHWELGPSYPLIRTLAEGISLGMKGHVDRGQPVVLVFDADIAKLVGNIIEKELLPGAGIISIDGIDLKDFDFIDIGEELPDAKAVPVVIKSLIFRHAEHGRGHGHGQGHDAA